MICSWTVGHLFRLCLPFNSYLCLNSNPEKKNTKMTILPHPHKYIVAMHVYITYIYLIILEL